jgi:vesicle-fusing ATPase
MGLSLTGDTVTIEPLPTERSPGAPAYLESIDIEVGFFKKGQDQAQPFTADDMAKNFLRAFNGQIFATGEGLIFDFLGINLRGSVTNVQTLDLSDNQKRGGGAPPNMGILMDKTDVNFIKAGDSPIKIKSSAKK